jgi:hypothetical protein
MNYLWPAIIATLIVAVVIGNNYWCYIGTKKIYRDNPDMGRFPYSSFSEWQADIYKRSGL